MSENTILNNNKICFDKRVALWSLVLVFVISIGIFLNGLFDSLSSKKLALNSRASEVPTPVRSGETEERAKKSGENKVEMGVGSGSETGPRVNTGKGGYYGNVYFIVYPYGVTSIASENDTYDNSKSIRLNIRGTTTYGKSCEQSGREYYSGKGFDWGAISKFDLRRGVPLNIPIFKTPPFNGNVFANIQIVNDRIDVTAAPADGVGLISYDIDSYGGQEPYAIKKFHGFGDKKRYFSIDPYTGDKGPLLGPGEKSAIVLSVDTQSLNYMGIRYESVNGSAMSPDVIFACIDLPEITGSK